MKVFLIKISVILLSIPAYPFITIGMYVERRSYYGNKTKFLSVSKEYWTDVKDALTYRKGK